MLDATASAPYSGWSSSYCIGSLLLQLQSVLFDERAAVFDRITLSRALALAQAYACPCGHRPGCVKPRFPTADEIRAGRARVTVSQPVASCLPEPPAPAAPGPPRSSAAQERPRLLC